LQVIIILKFVNEAIEVYGINNEVKIKESILKFPPFAGLNHSRVINEAAEVYGINNEGKIKEAILKFPSFAGLNHSRVINEATEVYGINNEVKIKESILKFSRFVALNHARVINEATEVYGANNEVKIKEAILKFPQFASLNHARIIKQKTKIGGLIGFSNQQTIDTLLENPVYTSYSYKRDLARIDVARILINEGVSLNEEFKDWFVKTHIASPYSPGTFHRISHGGGEPKLLTLARKKFADQIKTYSL